MSHKLTRRRFAKGIALAAGSAGLLSSVSMPATAGENYANSDKDAVVGSPSDDGAALASINQYPSYDGNDWYGTVLEEMVGHRHDVEMVQDLHVTLYDGDLGQTLDVRNDAAGSELSFEDSKVPEAHVHNWFQFESGYWADLYQDVLSCVDRHALLIRNEVEFNRANDHTVYTLVNPEVNDFASAGAEDNGYVTSADGYDVMVAHDGANYVAYAQRRLDASQRTFDGHRVGVEDVSSGSDRSAWTDVYEESDGWITTKDSNSGNVDTGVGLYVGGDQSVRWLTALGFGTSESEAIGNATAALDSGYETERSAFVDAWERFHDDVHSAPTGDTTADAMYERSLTAIKAAQDPAGGSVAGLFEPHGDQYTYVWPRDQVIMIQSLLSAGAYEDARSALSWLDDVQITETTYHETPAGETIDRKGSWWQNYFVDGTRNWELLQIDQVGGPIYAHWLTWQEVDGGDPGSAILDDHYEMSKLAARFLLDWDNGYGFPKKHNDPWEENWGYSTEGTAAAIAGLRSFAEMADAKGETDLATTARNRADTWASNLETYCYKTGAALGDHYVTCDSPEWDATPAGAPAPDERPDAAAFMAHWPWNVRAADDPAMADTVRATDDPAWTASNTPCLDRYPGDDYTPTDSPEDGGWPLTEAYADVLRERAGFDPDAVSEYVFDHAENWQTAAGLLPERVDGDGDVRWNSHLNWSQAMFVLLTEHHVRGEPFGYAPGE